MDVKKFTKFNPNIILGILLLAGITFSVIQIIRAAAPDPGHTWTEIGDAPGFSNWQYIGANALRPTSTIGIIVNASSTFTGDVTIKGNTAPTTLISSADVRDAVVAGYTAITGLSFTAAASTNYLIDCYINASSSAAATGFSFAWDTPASPTLILMTGFTTISTSVVNGFFQNLDNVSNGTSTAVIAAYAINPVILQTQFRNGTTAGTIQLGFTPETAAGVMINTGSVCQYRTY